MTMNPPNLRLYRGLGGGAVLPEPFFVRDENGCTGFTEWGLMSTTSKRDVAIGYSGVREKKPLPTVLEIKVGSVDRGACISAYSQYPLEHEYLFVPCSFVEQDGRRYLEVTKEGVVAVVPVRVNANLKTATIDDYIEQQRDLHTSAFRYLIDEVEQYLFEPRNRERAASRLQKDKNSGGHTVDSFLNRILQQCNEVYSRHQGEPAIDFTNDRKYRRLILEMVDVRTMAISKLEEWLENEHSSSIDYRINAQLRTVHRRRLTYLTQQVAREASEASRRKLALDLCKAKGIVFDSIDEKNDLGESPLMVSAAEGRSAEDLRLLVTARADMSAARPDGVCAMWLAAQFGNVDCISVLADLRADVNQFSTDKTTPVSIAAQMGNVQCVKRLIELKADFGLANNKKLTPLDQATANDHMEVASLLKKHCSEHLELQNGSISSAEANSSSKRQSLPGTEGERKVLIISTGDISDVDGLFALAEYCKTGSDVLFIMNYPAYLGFDGCDECFEIQNPGRGYRYTLKEVLERDPQEAKWPEGYASIRERYGNLSKADDMKAALTDMAFEIVSGIWEELSGEKGGLYFCIGGVNCINPFSATAIKNELLVYSRLVPSPKVKIGVKEGMIYDAARSVASGVGEPCQLNLAKYSKICIDFNGPMSFFDDAWQERLRESKDRICAAFVMGGVLSSEPPTTMPSIPGTLNRFSSATMNQLYHPQRAASFFSFLDLYKIRAFVVVNNDICDLATFDETDDGKVKNFNGVDSFLSSNGLDGRFLRDVARAHYEGMYPTARKPFDYYSAVALTAYLRDESQPPAVPSNLFYSGVYGLALVSASESWEVTRSEYAGRVDTSCKDEDIASERRKKESFRKELAIMDKLDRMDSIPVRRVGFADRAGLQGRGFKVELRPI